MHPNITCTFSACKHIGTHSHVVLDLLDHAPVFTPKHALKHVYKKKPQTHWHALTRCVGPVRPCTCVHAKTRLEACIQEKATSINPLFQVPSHHFHLP